MERTRRVYTMQRSANSRLSYLLLFLSLVVLLSGFVWRGNRNELKVKAIPSVTTPPLDEAFDETPVQREMTLEGSNWYAIQLGAFEEAEAAEEMSNRFSRRGAAGYVWFEGRHRALAAVYPLREDAQAVRDRLREIHEVDSHLFEIRLPVVKLRLNGMKGQLDILEAAFLHVNDLVRELQCLSVELDQQEINVREAEGRLESTKQTLELVGLRLQQRFSRPYHSLVDNILKILQDYSRFAEELPQDMNEVQLGTALKKQTLTSLYLLKNVYDTLSNT